MTVSGFWPIFALGMLGGLLVELLRWWRLRESSDFPKYAYSPWYWGLTVAMVLAGGLVTILYGLEETTAILPVNLGAGTPAIISALSKGPGQGSSTKDFLACNHHSHK
jgi:hypothetical protein